MDCLERLFDVLRCETISYSCGSFGEAQDIPSRRDLLDWQLQQRAKS